MVAVFLAVLIFISHNLIRTDVQSINDYPRVLMFMIVSLGVVALRIRIDRAEGKLRLHTAMMDNVTEGVYLIGMDDLIIKWTNEKFTRMFGYDPGEMVGKQVDIVNAPTESTPAETRMFIVDILKETGEWHGKVKNIKRDGTHFWCYANVSLFDHPEYGKVMLSVHTDITERKRAEGEVLLKNLVFEHSITANSISDNTGIITHVNDTFIRVWGYENRNEVIGKPISDFLKFEDDAKKIITALHETGKWEGEYTALKKDSTTFCAYGLATIIVDESGDTFGYQSAVLDITERKQMEELIKDSEERLRGLSEATFEAIFISEKGVCIEQNSAAEKMFGYTLSEAIGRKGTEWIAPEDREMVKHNMVSGYEEPYEATALRKDGSTFPAEIQGRMMHYKGRSVCVTALSDITERKQAEIELQKRMSELETFYRATLGREGRVIELKQEVNELLEQLGNNKKYGDDS